MSKKTEVSLTLLTRGGTLIRTVDNPVDGFGSDAYDLYSHILIKIAPNSLNESDRLLLAELMRTYTGSPFKISKEVREKVMNENKLSSLTVFNNSPRKFLQSYILMSAGTRQYQFNKQYFQIDKQGEFRFSFHANTFDNGQDAR